jgi:hypothetical protein
MKLNGQWIEVFRAGDYGEKGSYTPADLDKMIANYDPAKHEAPIVIGHPENNAPAFGWVESLKRVGNVLLAKLSQVQPQFEQMVRDGLFKKRSISFYTKPELMLRHVGFLGAMPPEVKGLAAVRLCEFREASDARGQFNEVEFNEEKSMDIKELKAMFEEALDNFKKKFAGDNEGKQFSDDQLRKIANESVEKETKHISEKLDLLAKDFADRKKADEDHAAKARTASFADTAKQAVAALKEKGRWVPAFEKMGVTQIFEELAKSETKLSFGEGDKKVEKTPVECFTDFLAGLPKMVPTGEIADAARKASKGNLVKFNEPTAKSGFAVDQDSVLLAEAASALAKKDKISYGEALTRVRAEGVTVEGGASAAAV